MMAGDHSMLQNTNVGEFNQSIMQTIENATADLNIA